MASKAAATNNANIGGGAPDAPAGAHYFAFISYSHQDKLWADWLHKALETYRVPSRLVGQVTAAGVIPPRLIPIFRDRDELASATDLSRRVNDAIAHSANLIVICSPHAAASRWVNEEVLAFKRLGNSERVFCLIVDGEPNATDLPGRAAEECFAHGLRHTVGADGRPTAERIEPIAADARADKDGKANAKLKLIAGLLDVGFDTLKQRELQRRHRRMAAVTAAALIVMGITTTLAISAYIARGDAERRQKQAEDLVGFMLGDLNDKLQEVNRLDIMEAVDDKAMAYFKALPTTDVTDEALEQRAKALEKIGGVRFDQGHLPAAMESYQAALKLSDSLLRSAPHDPARQIAHSRILAFVGMTEWFQGRLDAAQESFETGQSVLQHPEPGAPANPDLTYQLLVLDNNIGHVLEARGRMDEAEAQYRMMLQHSAELLAGKSVKAEWKYQSGAAHNNLGKVALMRGDLATAIEEYGADDAIETELSASDPKNNGQHANTFTVRAILGRTLALAGEVDTGKRNLQEAIDIATRLQALDPTNSGIQENLALYQMQLARLLRLSGDLARADALATQSLASFAALTKQDPDNTGWQREFAEVQTERARESVAAGRTADALRQARGALKILDPLFTSQPDDRATLLATAGARLLVANLTGEAQEQSQLRESALTATQSVKGGTGDPRLLALQVEALLALGRKADAEPVIQRLWQCGYRDLALVEILQREKIDYPANTVFQQRMQALASGNRST